MNKAQLKRHALKLYEEEYTYAEISREIDKPRSTVHRWVNELLYEKDLIEMEMEQDETEMEQSETLVDNSGTVLEQNGTINDEKEVEKINIGSNRDSNQANIDKLLQENDDLIVRIAKLQEKLELENRKVTILEDMNQKLSDSLSKERIENAIFESELELFECIYNISDDEYDGDAIPDSLNEIIIEFVEEILECDGAEYSKKEVQSFFKRTNVLIAEVENWPDFDDNSQNYEEIFQILTILQNELSEIIKFSTKHNVDEPEVSLSKKGRRAVEEYLDGVVR